MLVAEIWRRRVLHVCAAWLGAVWAATEVTSFAVSRYAVPDIWIDRVLLGGLLLTPLVAGAAWRIGAEGKVRWRFNDALVGIVGLALVALVLRFVTPSPTDVLPADALASKPAEVAIPEQPLLLIGEFRAAPSAVSDEVKPTAQALSLLLELDLQYASGFYASALPSLGQSGPITMLRTLGFKDWRNADAGAWRSIAKSLQFDALVLGELNRSDGQWQLTIERIRWMPEESREKKQYQASSSSELVDLVAADIRQWLSPNTTNEDPSLDSISAEQESTRIKYAQATDLIELENRPEEGLRLLDEVLSESPAFAIAEIRKLSAHTKLAQRDAMMTTLASLNRKLAQLPVRQRYQVQIMTAQMRNDAAEIQAIYELWLQEDPSAREPRSALAEQRFLKDGNLADLNEMAEVAKTEADSRALIRVAGVYDLQDMDKEADALRSLALSRDSNDLSALMAQAQALESRAQFEPAVALWRKARLLNPNARTPIVALARIQFEQGDFEGALRAAANIAADATHRNSRMAAANERAKYLYRLGRYGESRKVLEVLRTNEYEGLDPMQRSSNIDGPLANLIALTEGYAAAEAYLHQTITFAEPEMRDWMRDNYALEAARYAGAYADAERIALSMHERAETYVTSGNVWFIAIAGFMNFAQGEGSIPALKREDASVLEQVKRGQVPRDRHQLLRLQAIPALLDAKATEQAREWLDVTLRSTPNDPEANLLMACVEWQQGQREQARARVSKLAEVLAKADAQSHLHRLMQRVEALPGWSDDANAAAHDGP